MQKGYVSNALEKLGIQVHFPDSVTIETIDGYRKEVYAGTVTREAIEIFHSKMKNLSEVMPIIIACTELSIYTVTNKNIIDMVELQVRDAINRLA